MLICCATVLLALFGPMRCDYSSNVTEPQYAGLRKEPSQATIEACLQVAPPCVTEADHFSLEALRLIHREMDDDQDGGIEVEESVEFIIEDMQQQQQTNKHSKLHREDQHITVEELWRGWKSSEVHNWTQDDVLRWLREFVELPQYEKSFKEIRVNGNTLPRIASNEPSFMSGYLKIQDQQHKHKLKLKALDVVLFGPPTRPPHNWMKDLVLIVSVVMGVGGCLFAQAQNKTSKEHISKMMKDLESLQRAEQRLRDLQEQLVQAQEEKRTVAVEKQFLEEKMRDEIQGAQEEANRLQELRQGAVSELSRLRYAEEELEQVRGALKKAELDMQACWSVPESLQLWLQLTHEVEVQYYNVKKQSAEQQLSTAKEEAEKIKKKRSSVLGTLHVVHSSSLDQVDHKILEAKNALVEVTACLQERLHRWQQIEWLCGFLVMKNPGLPSLTATLYPDPNWMLLPRSAMSSYQMPAGVDDMEDSMPSVMPQIPVTVKAPIKLSPRAVVRSRRTGHIIPSPVVLSPDPDLLIPIRGPIPRYGEDEGERIIFPTLMKQECMETAPDPESTMGRLYPGTGLDTPPRRLYREDYGSSITRKVSFEEQEESPSRKISREDLGDSLRATSRKFLPDELAVENPVRKTSREELEASGETLMSPMGTEEADSRKVAKSSPVDITDSSLRSSTRDKLEPVIEQYPSTQRRTAFKERKNPSKDSLSRMMLGDEGCMDVQTGTAGLDADVFEVDNASKMMSVEDSGASVEAKAGTLLKDLSRDEFDVSMDFPAKIFKDKDKSSRKILQGELDQSMMPEKGQIFRGASMDSISRNKMFETVDPRRGMSLKERRGDPASASRKFSREERDVATERRRLFRDFRTESSADPATEAQKLQRDMPMPVEFTRRKISREEFPVADPGSLSQPDLTSSSFMLWAPPQELLSHLVYDGILEKSYQNPLNSPFPGDRDSTASMSASSQSLAASEASVRSDNASPPESSSGEKVKKPSKLKSLFKKKKDKEKDKEPTGDSLQGGLQKL
ncbi:stromal interaction molecule 2 [Astyanax mexicanus]|uniref:stromal interaction molecule 2 n=1 Tax=Astyanax mexicanus TaxID=7994 RepID=UPI0020CAE7E4|nr:stromal interaction molecule 2 [Astyanax mexicanus]